MGEENVDLESPRKNGQRATEKESAVSNGPKPNKYSQEETEVVEHSAIKIGF